jgi:hypothetical protein
LDWLKEQLENKRVVLFDYSDPEMHTLVLIGTGKHVYFIDNKTLSGPKTKPRIIHQELSNLISYIKGLINGEYPDPFYGEKSKKLKSKKNLFSGVSFKRKVVWKK